MTPSSHMIALNGVRLHYAEAPGPGPALVILHGLTGSHAEFLHLVPELAGLAHVYLLDLRGHGRSAWAAGGYRVADYGADVAAFLRQVVGRPAVLLGHSLGGAVSVWLAAYAPELLEGIFLDDPALYLLEPERRGTYPLFGYFAGLRDELPRHHASGAGPAQLAATVGATPADDGRTMLEAAGPEAVRERALQLHQVDPATLDPLLAGAMLGHCTMDELLAQVRCPAHLLAASPARGGVLSAQDLRRALAGLPGCGHAVVEGAGHDIHLDQPAALLRELRWFLASIPALAARRAA